MSSLLKRRRVKRPTVVVNRSQVTNTSLYGKGFYKPLYEKVKANNNALARALSQQKQKYQELFTEYLALTNEVQELKVACNRRDDAISTGLKNAEETFQLLVTIVKHTTNTIASFQQFATTTRNSPRRSTTNDRRESSTRRLSGESPARGVVQPMVSGHTITKPTINLSRLSIRREYRVQSPPKLSDIEEGSTPEASPAAPAKPSPVRVPITRPLNYGATRPNRLPERLRNSMRASDESERSSSVRSNRNSSSLLLSPSLPRGSEAVADTQNGECLRSPRVALHDVSRLLHNSQSVNIRTSLENSMDIDLMQPQPFSSVSMKDESTEIDDEDEDEHVDQEAERAASLATQSQWACQPSNFYKNLIDCTVDDDDYETSNLSRYVTRKRGSLNCDIEEFPLLVESAPRKKNHNFDINDLQLPVLESPIAPQVRPIVQEPELTANIQRMTMTQNCGHLPADLPRTNVNETVFEHTRLMLPIVSENPDSARTSTALGRGSDDDGDDARSDKRKRKRKHEKKARGERNSFFKKTANPPDLPSALEATPTLKTDSARRTTTVVEHESDEEDAKVVERKRKTAHKKKADPPDSPSDTENAPTPERKNIKSKRKPSRAKDLSSAKVVLQTLSDNYVKKRSPSPEHGVLRELDNRQSESTQRDVSSDSAASSTASLPSKILPTRPRRQKAPANMREPSLRKQLRRN